MSTCSCLKCILPLTSLMLPPQMGFRFFCCAKMLSCKQKLLLCNLFCFLLTRKQLAWVCRRCIQQAPVWFSHSDPSGESCSAVFILPLILCWRERNSVKWAFRFLCPRSPCIECFRKTFVCCLWRMSSFQNEQKSKPKSWICFYSALPNAAVIENDLCIICPVCFYAGKCWWSFRRNLGNKVKNMMILMAEVLLSHTAL